jgi:hypothetical protein
VEALATKESAPILSTYPSSFWVKVSEVDASYEDYRPIEHAYLSARP